MATCTTFSTSATLTPWRAQACTVDLDLEVGLADDVEQADVLDPRDRSAGCSTTRWPVCFEVRQIGADDLDRVGPLDARERLFDVVADELREVEVDPGKCRRTSPSARPMSAAIVCSQTCAKIAGFSATLPSASSGTLISRLKKLVTSVPSSGRPRCDITRLTSGTEAITSRSLRSHPGRLSQRDRPRQDRPDPEITFLERRHELAAQVRNQKSA